MALVIGGDISLLQESGDVPLARGDILALEHGEIVTLRAEVEAASAEVLVVEIFRP